MRDERIWRELPPLSSGHVPVVRRRWRYVGLAQRGSDHCNVLVTLREAPGRDWYGLRAVSAGNGLFTPDAAHCRDLRPAG